MHSWLIEDADTLPAVIDSLLDGLLGTALAEQVQSVRSSRCDLIDA